MTTKKVYELDGKDYTLTELCNHLGIRYKPVYDRLRQGKDINTAISECVNNPRTWGKTYGESYSQKYKRDKPQKQYENGI